VVRLFALLQPDGSILTARPKGRGWAVDDSLQGIEKQGRNLTVFLDGLDVLGLSATIPARTEKEACRAAPFAVEDDIGETVELSHVALAELDKAMPAGPRAVNVISRGRMTEILKSLSDRGLQEAELVAAHSVLPPHDLLYQAPGLVIGRIGGRSFSIDPSLGEDVLISMTDGSDSIEVYGEQVSRALGREASRLGAGSRAEFLVQLATWVEKGHSLVRLRQGEFEVRRSLDLDGIGRWKLAGAMVGVALIAWFGAVILETRAMGQRADNLQSLAQEFARVGWPEANGNVQQVLSRTGNLATGQAQPFIGLLDATALLYDALEQVEGSELRTLRYDRARRQMTATIAFQSFADVDRLTAILNRGGLAARSGDARQSGTKVIGDLTLERAS
jgi:general secretion pathway protein L